MKRLLLCLGLLAGATSCLTESGKQPGRQRPTRLQPPRQPDYPHFRPAQSRKLKPYKPKTWRERIEEPKPPAEPAPAAE